MSRFISVSIEAPAIINVTSSEVVSHKIRNSTRNGVNLEVANIIDKYVSTQKNRMQEERIRSINTNCLKIKSKLLTYAKSPSSEIARLLEPSTETEHPLRLSCFINKIIDVNQKYEKPIYQKMGVVNQVANIQKYKEFKKNTIKFSELSTDEVPFEKKSQVQKHIQQQTKYVFDFACHRGNQKKIRKINPKSTQQIIDKFGRMISQYSQP